MDHWTFGGKHPRNEAWRRAAPTESEVGLRAADWADEPYDRRNALAMAHDAWCCAPEPETLW